MEHVFAHGRKWQLKSQSELRVTDLCVCAWVIVSKRRNSVSHARRTAQIRIRGRRPKRSCDIIPLIIISLYTTRCRKSDLTPIMEGIRSVRSYSSDKIVRVCKQGNYQDLRSSRLWILPEIADPDLIPILNSGNLHESGYRTSFWTRDLSIEGVPNVTGIAHKDLEYDYRL